MANEKFIFSDPSTGFYTETQAAVTAFTGAAGAIVQTTSSGKIDDSLINFAAFDKVFAVRSASYSNLNLAAPGSTIGGVTMAAGQSFLARGQTDATQNGIYTFNGDSAPATRRADYDTNVEIQAGDLVVVEEGTYAERMFILATNNPITIGSTALSFAPLGVALTDAGTALSYSDTTLNVNVAPNKGIQVVSNNLQIKPIDFASTGLVGTTDLLAIDFVVTGSNQNSARAVKGSDLINFGANQGAKIIGYDNSLTSNYTAAVTAQQAIDDAFAYAQTPGVLYTAGTGGVTKGQLVYVSSANTVSPYTDISVARNVVGIAATSAVAGSPVKILVDSTVLVASLSGATPGVQYYWNGTGLVPSIPAVFGSYIWQVGVAKSTVDLHVNVSFLKRNSLV